MALPYPHIDPVAFQIGPAKIYWYGLMYVTGFIAEYGVLRWQNRIRQLNLSKDDLWDFIGHLIMGVIIGGRLGYVLIYYPQKYFANPLEILAVWNGGMAFHGGVAGTLLFGWWWCRKRGISFLEMADMTAVGVPIGLGLGRLGNFINGELWGKTTSVPWAMVFPAGGDLPRHPSQLYEFFLEGVFLFALLAWLGRRTRPRGTLIGLLLLGYGMIRFGIEFLRSPDVQFISATHPTGSVLGPLTMGQSLSLPMIAAGLVLLGIAFRSRFQVGENRGVDS